MQLRNYLPEILGRNIAYCLNVLRMDVALGDDSTSLYYYSLLRRQLCGFPNGDILLHLGANCDKPRPKLTDEGEF
jgi:hypothetical protein